MLCNILELLIQSQFGDKSVQQFEATHAIGCGILEMEDKEKHDALEMIGYNGKYVHE